MLALPLLAALLLSPQVATHEWVPVDGPIFPSGQAAYDAGRGRLVMLGTEGGTWEFDGDTRLQRANLGSSGPITRSRGAMAADPERGLTLLFGGTTGPAAFPPYLGDTWLWDGSAWTPGVGANSPPDRIYGVMGFDTARGCFVLYGGQVDGGPSNDTWEYDANGWREVQTANSPQNIRGWMAYDSARGVLVMLSSPSFAGLPLCVDEYDGVDWTSRSVSGAWPVERSNMSVAYDEARQVIVMIGGATYGGDEIWEWDGDAWSLVHTLAEPWRINAPAYYDAGLGAVVVVGGSTSTKSGSPLITYTDAYTWDGVTFAQRRGDHSPSIRSDSVLFADPLRGKLVLGAGWPLDDTWEWDGNAWTQIQGVTQGPSPRQFASSTFDTARGVGLVFGGRRGVILDELWSWDGSDWTELPSTTRPSPRYHVGLAFDTARAKAVLYGGAYNNGFVLNLLRGTWEWDGATWTKNTATTSSPQRSLASRHGLRPRPRPDGSVRRPHRIQPRGLRERHLGV